MELQHYEVISQAVAPIVMVSAAGLLFMGLQTKNLHLADRIRALMTEYRTLAPGPADEKRRSGIVEQLVLFNQRIRLSQHALELLYISIVCFVLTSLLLAAAPWLSGFVMAAIPGAMFLSGVGLLVLALLLEFREMRLGLKTIVIEVAGALDDRRGG
jgi:Protein of unknown function (DUF2721)